MNSETKTEIYSVIGDYGKHERTFNTEEHARKFYDMVCSRLGCYVNHCALVINGVIIEELEV